MRNHYRDHTRYIMRDLFEGSGRERFALAVACKQLDLPSNERRAVGIESGYPNQRSQHD
jgi:hypothetical protein